MAKRYAWPTCTVPNCGCVRTWETEAAAILARVRHLGSWELQPEGYAVCLCHGAPVATFPCDKSQAQMASG